MVNWDEIKKKIISETQQLFRNKPKFNISGTIELFEQVITFPLNKPELKLDGLETRVPNAIEKILVVDAGKNDSLPYFSDFAKVEPYLRKILYLINPNKFFELESRNAGLAAFINGLNLNTNNIDFSSSKIEDFKSKNDFDEHLFRTYSLRNIESHQCENWTNREFYENVESVLIFYLYATSTHSSLLKSKVENIEKAPDFKEYLNSVKDNFKTRIGRFIHIKGQENIKLSHGYVIENITDEESEKAERKGTVDELRKNRIPEKRMLIWGDAGMGKSTTLEYLAYIDAEVCLTSSSAKIPVYISLGLLTDKNISIKQTIFNKIGVDTLMGEKMLKQGEINIFLDAVNEIPKDDNYQLKTIRQKEIKNLLNDYTNAFIIISDRPQEENIFRDIPVFHLLKMEREQIEDFIKKNTDGSSIIAEKILNEIEKDARLEKIIKTPLMLSRLIEIVKVEGEIPKSEGEIIDRFIHSLYRREKEEKMDANFDIKKIHRLLRYLGYESLEKKDTNSGMSEDEVLNCFTKCKKDYGFDIDTIYVLEKATQLGILERREDLYVFAHQAYQDYYHSQEEKGVLGF